MKQFVLKTEKQVFFKTSVNSKESDCKDKQINQGSNYRSKFLTQKIFENLKKLQGKKSIRVNKRMSKIMNMPIKVDVHMYVMHAKSQTLYPSSQ